VCWWLSRAAWRRPVLGLANVFQTIPSLALFGLLIPVFGIGAWTAITALVVYALLPIVRNTYVGITGVDPAVREAGRGMGMTDGELLRLVELPLAAGVILAGVRIATVVSVGIATIAAAIGAAGSASTSSAASQRWTTPDPRGCHSRRAARAPR